MTPRAIDTSQRDYAVFKDRLGGVDGSSPVVLQFILFPLVVKFCNFSSLSPPQQRLRLNPKLADSLASQCDRVIATRCDVIANSTRTSAIALPDWMQYNLGWDGEWGTRGPLWG